MFPGGRGWVDQTTQDLFMLALILILVVYFVGVSTNVATLGAVVGNVGNVFTGRNSAGQFGSYPAAA